MVNSKQEVVAVLKGNKEKIYSLGAKHIGLFGSFVRNEMNDTSDVDILVDFEEGENSYDNLFNLYELITSLTNRKVEVVTKEGLSKYIGPYILNEVEYVV